MTKMLVYSRDRDYLTHYTIFCVKISRKLKYIINIINYPILIKHDLQGLYLETRLAVSLSINI